MMFGKPGWDFPVRNELEANLLGQILEEEGVQFVLIRHNAGVFGGAMDSLEGYGHFQPAEGHREALQTVYQDFFESTPEL